MIKRIVCVLGAFVLCFNLFSQQQTVQKQSSGKKSESSVEDEYLSDIDGIVILGLATSDEYENKLYAMQMLEAAVDAGNINPDVMKALNQLAGEGINSQSRTNGRLINNFPDIRRRACLTLGKVKTEESKNFLMEVTLAENEPMVISAAVNSLGEIGMNGNDEVVNAIAFANRRNQILNPTSSLATEVVDCYAKLINSTENRKPVIDSLTQIASDYHYNKTVRDKALKLLKSISKTTASTQTSSEDAK